MPNDTRFQITSRYLTAPSKRRSGLAMNPGVRFIVAHDTGNPRSTANGNVGYYERSRNEESASAHIFVDDREILECIPALTAPPEKAWHVRYNVPTDDQLYGHDANDAAIGVEYCYGDNINADAAYDRYVWVIALAVHKFNLDPKTCIVGHFFLDPQRKTDPNTGLAHSRRTYEQLLRDVATEHAKMSGPPPAMVERPIAPPASVLATASLNLRRGSPNCRAPVHQIVTAGTPLTYAVVVDDGEPVNGNATWYGTGTGVYFWSGGVKPA